MKFLAFKAGDSRGLAVLSGSDWRGLTEGDNRFPGHLDGLIPAGPNAIENAYKLLSDGEKIDENDVQFLPPLSHPGKIICVGLNYHDHSQETKFEQPDYPTLFTRFASSLVAHGQPLILPKASDEFDYEGELVAVIGKAGRYVKPKDALDHVAGWSIFNDASVRDYQFKTPQWTIGKNFDDTGAFGPYFVTPEELPAGARGLLLETRLNGQTVQSASTENMVFDVATIITIVSAAMTLEPGDIIVTGTPSGVGMARKPALWMKDGDTVEVKIEGLGVLRNPIVAEKRPL